ncbi:MAG TPA: TIGR03016 family PEP-CTERM system-associated outer membrane protein [Aquabacterium sp.]|uniref:TIGR03016 family PEP-CTERM system-associated outer membrane protein n=1 Tax=Aquabacterium sp. TaxID=1872578 RepID=UPI002E351969|nr:TIGR03016 family PEP-CTERM system-associated outer membrane protein [Aquabacterium sp.]HEX5358045.1 TIGR03016 family PEP-CTERM system-associated outer membrane protein [Aquabacterium sp.]
MATTHPETAISLACLLLAGGCALPAAQAQTQTTKIQPTLDLQVLSTDNVNAAASGPRQSDVITTATAGVNVKAKGANATLEGQYRLSAVNYANGTQPDRILPSGALNLHTDILRQGVGLDANVSSEQVQANFNNATTSSSTPNTANTYTNTRYGLSPYISRPLDADTHVEARLGRTWLKSSQNSTALAARPNSYADDHRLLLTRRPTRIGYELDADYQTTHISGQSDPSLTQKSGKASVLYALSPELEVGLTAGRESTQVLTRKLDDTIRGARFQWRPGERTLLKAQVEDRFFGKAWQVEATHRSPWLALGFSSRRQPETYTSSLGTWQAGSSMQSLYDAMLTTRITNPVERKNAVADLIASRNLPTTIGSTRDAYDLGAVLRETTTGRLAVMGRRDVLTLSAGLNRSHPLLIDSTVSLLPPPRTKEYFFDTQLNHRLTPLSTISGGLRWSRAVNTPDGQAPILSRDFSWRATFNTALSSDATASMGLKHQISHTPSTTSSDESSMFVGLGYRF